MQTLELVRNEKETPWGFRLIGGVDFDTAITVCKVEDDSIADKANLKHQDKILKINNTEVYGLTHAEIHSLMIKSENNLKLDILRDEENDKIIPVVEKDILSEIKKEIEIEENNPRIHININFTNFENDDDNFAKISTIDTTEKNTDHELIGVTFKNCNPEINIRNDTKVLRELSHAAVQSRQKQFIRDAKKWSTFLQKPNWPIPKPKKLHENRKKALTIDYKTIKKSDDEKNQEIKEEIESEIENNIQSQLIDELNDSKITKEEKEIENLNEEIDICLNSNESEIENNIQNEYENVHNFEPEKLTTTTDSKKNENLEIMSNTNNENDIDNELNNIEERLNDLLQLPKSFELLITSLTTEIFNILKYIKKTQQFIYKNQDNLHEKKHNFNEFENFEEDFEMIEISEYSDRNNNVIMIKDSKEIIIEHDIKAIPTDNQKNSETEHMRTANNLDQIDNNNDNDNDNDNNKNENLNESCPLTETTQYENIITKPLIPLERPIILPGGIKWRKPVDAFPQVNPDDLTDEFIAETLNSQSEILSGKVIGQWVNKWPWFDNKKPIYRINFKKFNQMLPPPPTTTTKTSTISNIDEIKLSEVYKMIQEYDQDQQKNQS